MEFWLEPVRDALTRFGIDKPDVRAALIGSQLMGLAMARYIVSLEPVASASASELVAAVGPAIQRYITGDISNGGAG